MSSSEVDIHIVAFDEASSVIESLGSTMSTTFQDIEEQAQNLASTTDEAGSQMTTTFQNIEGQTENLGSVTEESTSQMSLSYDDVQFSLKALGEEQDNASASFGNTMLSMNNVALAGTNLFMSFERVENAQVMVDRANLMVQRSTETCEKAQTAYNDAVAKYGPNSQQAKDALDRLTIAQEAVQVAHERADMSARNYNNTILMTAVTVIPSLVSIIGTVSHAQEIWNGLQQVGASITAVFTGVTEAQTVATEEATGAQTELDVALDANPIGIIIMAIAGLVAGFIAAYTYCKPFRDVVNELGAALSGALLTAINAVRDAASFLWSNVFKPMAEFIIHDFVANVTALKDVLNFLWNNVLVPIGNFITGTFGAALKFVTDLFQKLYEVVKPIVDAINTVKDVMGGFVNTISGALSSAGSSIQNFISSICFAHALARAADDSKTTMDGWSSMVHDHLTQSLSDIKNFNANADIEGVPKIADASSARAMPLSGLGAGATKPTINITAPLVQIQGSADKSTMTAVLARLKEELQNIIIEPTSTSTFSRKRVRIRGEGAFSS